MDIPIEILRLAEAFIFASPEPVTYKALEPVLPRDIDPFLVMEALERHCADRGVILAQTGTGWSFRTAPDLAPKLRGALTETRRLPRVAMETLVVIALHQPVTRPDIEQIRGVSLSQATMDLAGDGADPALGPQGRHQFGQALGKGAPGAVGVAAVEPAHPQADPDPASD